LTIGHYKILVDGATTITDDFGLVIENRRPESNVSSLLIQVPDYRSSSYSDVFDVHTQIDLQIKHATAGYVTTFSGIAHKPKPIINPQTGGEVLEVQAWGWGIAFDKTTCDTSYGSESANPTKTTAKDILQHLIPNYVEKRWGGDATNWSIDVTDVEDVHNDFDVVNLTGTYTDNFTMINRLCDLINAHAISDSDISVHWYVDTDGHFRIKEIDQDSADASWKHYYGGSSANATFKEGVNDVLARNFQKQIDDYYNSIVLASAFRKPAYDIWCGNGAPAWGNFQSVELHSASQHIVGDYSLEVTPTVNNDPAVIFYPSTHDAGWDFTKCGSSNTIPKVSFYIFATDSTALTTGTGLVLGKYWDGVVDASGDDVKYYMDFSKLIANPQDNKWFHVDVPIGPYWALAPELANTDAEWIKTDGADEDWADIDFVAIGFAGVLTTKKVYIDDLHFSGKVVRHCYDASAITATTKERQLLVRLDSALDDTLSVTNNNGTAALLAQALLYQRSTIPVVGTMSFPLIEDMLPGQTLQVYAGLESDGSTYRWSNLPMRNYELIHRIDSKGLTTTVELTSDVSNSNVMGAQDAWGIMADQMAALSGGQAKDLKASGIDPLIPRLSWDPT
jgi:hypothetical protein